jgi:hypothetical protein
MWPLPMKQGPTSERATRPAPTVIQSAAKDLRAKRSVPQEGQAKADHTGSPLPICPPARSVAAGELFPIRSG